MDPRQYVRPGDPIRLAASQINGLNRLLSSNGGYRGGPQSELHTPYTWVYGKNNTGATVSRWAVLAITGMATVPSSSTTATAQFEQLPIVACGTPNATTTAWCVATEPIRSGGIGRVAVGGVVQVKSNDLQKAAGCHVLWKDTTWALIRIDVGVIRGTFSAPWSKGTSATVTDAIAASKTYTAKNYFASMTGSGTKACAIAYAGGEWILIAAEC